MVDAIATTPNINVNGVPIVEQDFKWSLTAGVTPYTTHFLLDNVRSNILSSSFNPSSLTIEISGGLEINPKKEFLFFENLFLHEPKAVDDFSTIWKISDQRYIWRGQKFYGGFNLTRLRNEVGQANTSPATDPASLRLPFDVFSKGRYITNSVKPDGTPFTISQIIQQEFPRFGINIDVLPFVDSGDYVVENLRYDGVEVYTALADLLKKGRLNLGINRDGSLYVFSIDFFDDNELRTVINFRSKKKIKPGVLYRQDLKRIRPKKVRVRFQKMQETLVKFVPSPGETSVNEERKANELVVNAIGGTPITQERIDARSIIGCANVIQVPFVPDNISQNLRVGEYIPIADYLNFLNIPENDVRELWWTDTLEQKFSFQLQSGSQTPEIEALARTVISAVRSAFRQQFMIDPFFLDRIDFWEDKSVDVIDNFSGYRAPSPVWSDFCIVPRIRNVEIAQRRALHSDAMRNWLVDIEDPDRVKPTAGRIRIVNMELGVFRIEYPKDIDNVIDTIIPSAVDNLPAASPAGATSLSRFMLTQQSPLSKNFTMETIISIVWLFSSDGLYDSTEKYEIIEFDYTNDPDFESEGPNIEFLSKREYARLDRDLNVVNSSIIEAIARSEAGRIMNQFRDRFIGVLTLPGIENISLDGNIREISYGISRDLGLHTVIDMNEIPFDPELIQSLPDEARNFLFKQLWRGGP